MGFPTQGSSLAEVLGLGAGLVAQDPSIRSGVLPRDRGSKDFSLIPSSKCWTGDHRVCGGPLF